MSEEVTAAHEAAPAVRSPRPGRITVEESFLDMIHQIACGDLETWRRIYAAAQADPSVRHAVTRAAGMVDPDFANAGLLWRSLVGRMAPVGTDAVAAVPAGVASRGAVASAEASGRGR